MVAVERRRSRKVERAALGVLIVLYLLGFKANGDRVDQINAERARNTAASCRTASEQNGAILAYLKSLGGTPAQIEAAAVFFPVRSPDECAARADQQVTP